MKKVVFALYYDALFHVFPGGYNFFLSLWHRRQYYKSLEPKKTGYGVLEDMLFSMELKRDKGRLSKDELRLFQQLSYASNDADLMEEIVEFLDSAPLSRQRLKEVVNKLASVTRFDHLKRPAGGETEHTYGERGVEMGVPAGTDPVTDGRLRSGYEVFPKTDVFAEKAKFYAKTYFIAAHLYFELRGDEGEYKRLSVQLEELKDFVRRQFGAGELPGTFDNWKGYSYRPILTGNNRSEKGQLKTSFGQIASHPEVFGRDVANMAQSILSQHFE